MSIEQDEPQQKPLEQKLRALSVEMSGLAAKEESIHPNWLREFARRLMQYAHESK